MCVKGLPCSRSSGGPTPPTTPWIVTSGSLVRMSKRRKPSYIIVSPSPGVADPVDAPGLVVRDQQCAVGHDEHVRGPTGRGAALEPAGGKGLVGRRAPAVDLHERDAVAARGRGGHRRGSTGSRSARPGAPGD